MYDHFLPKIFFIFIQTKQYNMSDNLFPSVEEVQKWSPGKVINFLKHKQDDLFLKDKHIEVIEDQEVAGRDFLELNVEKLTKYGLKGGPAERIEGLTRDIKSEGQGK